MKIDKVMEVLNEALAQKDLDLWLRNEEIKDLKKEVEDLQEANRILAEKLKEVV